jgi:hypothetical protein
MEIKCVNGDNPCHTNQYNIKKGADPKRHECPMTSLQYTDIYCHCRGGIVNLRHRNKHRQRSTVRGDYLYS